MKRNWTENEESIEMSYENNGNTYDWYIYLESRTVDFCYSEDLSLGLHLILIKPAVYNFAD